jgi:peroxiredoxin
VSFAKAFLLAMSVGAPWISLGVRASEAEKTAAPSSSNPPRGDVTSDPLLYLLRAPEVRKRLALQATQAEKLDQIIGEIDEPLWRLRDAQFVKAEYSTKAWQLVEQLEAGLDRVLRRDQRTLLRQLLVQSRGIHALLSSDLIEGLKLPAEQTRQIADIFAETQKQIQQVQQASADKQAADRSQQVQKLLADERTKAVALLSDGQKKQWLRLAGKPFDFSQLTRRYVRAPELREVDEWINSTPLPLADLKGKVVALHFFTFGCINCIHNQPAYKDWCERFAGKDVVVLGIHTPEGEGDRKLENIRKAIDKQAITYPVAVDNQKKNWTAWANHTWPAVYLIDTEGYVRYWWYGELNWHDAQGEKLYREKIAQLLAEKSSTTTLSAAAHPQR